MPLDVAKTAQNAIDANALSATARVRDRRVRGASGPSGLLLKSRAASSSGTSSSGRSRTRFRVAAMESSSALRSASVSQCALDVRALIGGQLVVEERAQERISGIAWPVVGN